MVSKVLIKIFVLFKETYHGLLTEWEDALTEMLRIVRRIRMESEKIEAEESARMNEQKMLHSDTADRSTNSEK